MMKMKAKRMISLLLAVMFCLSVAATPAFAAAAGPESAAPVSTELEPQNDVVSIRLTASGELVYGGYPVHWCYHGHQGRGQGLCDTGAVR